MKHSLEKCFPPYDILNSLLKIYEYGYDATIGSTEPSREYYGYPNVVEDLDFINPPQLLHFNSNKPYPLEWPMIYPSCT